MAEEKLYKINDDYYFKMDSTNFILVKKTITEKGKNIGSVNYPSIAFYPPSQKGIEMIYEKYLSLNLLDAEDDASCLKDLVEELKYYHADFLNFLSELNMDVPIKDLETIKIPKKKIEKDIKPIKKKRKMLRRKKK